MRLNASPAWRYFRRLSPTEAQCRKCEAILPVKKGSTSRLLAHIKLNHAGDHDTAATQETAGDDVMNVASLVPTESILRSLSGCWTSGESSQDVVIHCRDGHLAAHRLVLASVSNILYQEFRDNSHQGEVTIILPDFSRVQVRDFLADVYACVDLSKHGPLNSVLGVDQNIYHSDRPRESGNGFPEDDSLDTEDGNIDLAKENIAEKEEEGNQRPAPIKKERKNKSLIWKHFSVEGGLAQCNHCDLKVACAKSKRDYILNHLIRNHFNLIQVEDIPGKYRFAPEDEGEHQEARNDSAEEPECSEGQSFTPRISENGFQCLICLKNFSSRSSWKYHLKYVHSGLQPFKCEVCEKHFNRKESYQCHMQSHKNRKEFMCSECGKRFNLKRVRDAHEKTHDKEMYKKACSFCGKKFMNNQQVRKHEKIHTGEKSFECDQCGRRFRERHQLVTHLRVHTGERPYQCGECGEWFKHYSTRNNHKCKPDTDTPDQSSH